MRFDAVVILILEAFSDCSMFRDRGKTFFVIQETNRFGTGKVGCNARFQIFIKSWTQEIGEV